MGCIITPLGGSRLSSYGARNLRFFVTPFSSMGLRKRRRIPRVALLIETTRTFSRDMLAGVRRYVAEHGPWSTFLELRAPDSAPPAWLRYWDGDGILTRTFTREMADLITAT